MGTLYVVSTPIGNLEDVGLRALRVLKEVSLIAAEDTRHTRKLLSHYGISTPAISYHAHNEAARVEPILERLEYGDVALVSDAGTPGLSDPGRVLIQAAIAAGHQVTAVPGPSAVMDALVLSGFDISSFTYLGFPPRRQGERRELLASIAGLGRPLVFFEAPHRLIELLEDLRAVLGDRQCAVARELTKVHEEVRREALSAAIAHFRETPPRGELTIVVEGAARQSEAERLRGEVDREQQARTRLQELVGAGSSSRDAVQRVVGELGLPRRVVYQIWLELAGEAERR